MRLTARGTAAVLVLAAVLGLTATTWNPYTRSLDRAAVSQPAEDEPGWNCFTMGNRSCGTLPHVTPEMAGDVYAEGDTEPPRSSDTRRWEDCVVADDRTVMCPDGFVLLGS